MRQITPIVKNLIIINALMLLAAYVIGDRFHISLDNLLGLHYYKSQYFKPYQFVTHMFMHGGIMHLFFNMYALFLFGVALESVWGSRKFFTFYIITGLGAALINMLVNYFQFSHLTNEINAFINSPSPLSFELLIKKHFLGFFSTESEASVSSLVNAWTADPNNTVYLVDAKNILSKMMTELMDIPVVGASGAIFGVLLGFGMLFPNTILMFIFPPIPIKAKYVVLIYGAI